MQHPRTQKPRRLGPGVWINRNDVDVWIRNRPYKHIFAVARQWFLDHPDLPNALIAIQGKNDARGSFLYRLVEQKPTSLMWYLECERDLAYLLARRESRKNDDEWDDEDDGLDLWLCSPPW